MTTRDQRSSNDDPQQPDQFGLLFSRLVRIAGLIIALYEAFLENADRPALLALAGTMMSGSLFVDAVLKRGKGS